MPYYNDNQSKTAKKCTFFWKYGGFLLLLQNKILTGSMVLYVIVNV